MEGLQCYLCYHEDSKENPFASDPLPCNCKGGIVIHKACLLDVIDRSGDICSICQTKYRAKSYLSVDEEGCILRISVHNNNRVKYHENEHGQKHGSYIEYYEKTALVKQKCYYVNGIIHGPYEKLFRNGSFVKSGMKMGNYNLNRITIMENLMDFIKSGMRIVN